MTIPLSFSCENATFPLHKGGACLVLTLLFGVAFIDCRGRRPRRPVCLVQCHQKPSPVGEACRKRLLSLLCKRQVRGVISLNKLTTHPPQAVPLPSQGKAWLRFSLCSLVRSFLSVGVGALDDPFARRNLTKSLLQWEKRVASDKIPSQGKAKKECRRSGTLIFD